MYTHVYLKIKIKLIIINELKDGVLDASVPVQLSACMPARAAGNGSSIWGPATHLENSKKLKDAGLRQKERKERMKKGKKKEIHM